MKNTSMWTFSFLNLKPFSWFQVSFRPSKLKANRLGILAWLRRAFWQIFSLFCENFGLLGYSRIPIFVSGNSWISDDHSPPLDWLEWLRNSLPAFTQGLRHLPFAFSLFDEMLDANRLEVSHSPIIKHHDANSPCNKSVCKWKPKSTFATKNTHSGKYLYDIKMYILNYWFWCIFFTELWLLKGKFYMTVNATRASFLQSIKHMTVFIAKACLTQNSLTQ